MEAVKALLDWLEAERKLLVKGRALALAQRALLYAADELAMARMRLRVRLPGELVRPHEAHFKLHEAEVPVKNKVRHLHLYSAADATAHRVIPELAIEELIPSVSHILLSHACCNSCRLCPECFYPCLPSACTAAAEAGAIGSRLNVCMAVQELTLDRIAADADLSRTLGTLRYLSGLRAAQAQKQQSPSSPLSPKPDVASGPPSQAAAAMSPFESDQRGHDHAAGSSGRTDEQAVAAAAKSEASHCPVCQDALASEFMMLTCGHMLCARCCMTLIERLPAIPVQVLALLSHRVIHVVCM